MLTIRTELEGKKITYGNIKEAFEQQGFVLGGNWEYNQGFFDSVLSKEGGETVYLRIPFQVVSGALDEAEAVLQFGTPFVLKHVVHTGVDHDAYQHPIMDQAGLSALVNQFQTPIDPDGELENPQKWEAMGKRALDQLQQFLPKSP